VPIYEYRCAPCGHDFEQLIRSASETAHCPRCGAAEVAKQFSVPAAAQTGAGGSAGLLPVCGDPSPSFGCGGGGCATGLCGLE